MPAANYEYVDPAINVFLVKGLLRKGCASICGTAGWISQRARKCRARMCFMAVGQTVVTLDAQALLHVLERRWREYFHASFPPWRRTIRSYVNELWDARDRCAHRVPPNYFSDTETEHVLGTAVLLLTAIEANPEA